MKDYKLEFHESWINDKIVSGTIKFAEDFAEDLSKGKKEGRDVIDAEMTTSQVRKFFGEVKRQQMTGFDESKFVMLKPKLAYAVGRAKKSVRAKNYNIACFEDVISKAIDTVLNNKTEEARQIAFKNFVDFFEAIVAYHKKYVKD